jgi:hypothetical protein
MIAVDSVVLEQVAAFYAYEIWTNLKRTAKRGQWISGSESSRSKTP